MNPLRPRIIISALKGGAGKTTVSLSLASALGRKGLSVVPFKKGPDYIDAGWLCRAVGVPCRNLDPYLMDWPGVRRLFLEGTTSKTIALIEGNRGLYDGLDVEGSTSTAELAIRLTAPVVLVLDCTKATRTVAAQVLGCLHFDPRVNIAGVILNQTAGPRHRRIITDCLTGIGVPVLGVLPRFKRDLPERHMGLVPHQEHPEVSGAVDWLADLAEEHLDLDALIDLARSAPKIDIEPEVCSLPVPVPAFLRIGVIEDSAFQFYYPENLEALRLAGAEPVVISALSDAELPPLDGLYIGGGFPETQARALADNESFRNSVRRASEAGLPIYAECGGLMYLSRSLTMDGRTYPMTGALPLAVDVQRRPQGHGYTEVLVEGRNPFYPPGAVLKGHEFHYSRVTDLGGLEDNLVFRMTRGHGIVNGRDGVCVRNTLATYTHIHALGTPQWAAGFIASIKERQAAPRKRHF